MDTETIALLGGIATTMLGGIGFLGKWMMNTITQSQERMIEVIQNNTAALATMSVIIEKCKK